MNVLITSGGTREAIDSVRSITNHSTGKLGALIAETFLAAGQKVTLVTTRQAVLPAQHANLTILYVDNVASLAQTLEPLVKTHDALIHSMAVSDYTPVYMTGLDEVTASKNLRAFLDKSNNQGKISSADDVQVLFLKKTPKVISLVKEWNPSIRLIGFKLLVDVSKEELFSVARASLSRNQAELIVANDLTDINAHQHIAYLVTATGEQKVHTKQEIANSLLIYLAGETHG